MLSKAEIQYLQGQKQVSKSFERKSRCLIRKKVGVLQKELPLISNIFAGNIKFVFSEILNEKDGQPQPLREKDWNMNNIRNFKEQNPAPEFSNGIIRSNEIDKDNLGDGEGLEGSKSSSNDLQTSEATKFGNKEKETATKNSNSDEKRRRERDLNPRGPHGPQAI